MKILIISAVMVQGTAVFPTQVTGKGKDEKTEPTIIDVDKKIGSELVRAKQARTAKKDAKANFEIQSLEQEQEEDYGDFFEDEDLAEEE